MKQRIVTAGLLIYFVVAGWGPFISPGLGSPWVFPWIAGYLSLLLFLSFEYVKSPAPVIPVPFRFIALGILFMNFVLQLTGGAHSTLWSAYYLFTVVFAALSRLRQAFAMAFTIIAVELASLLVSGQYDTGRWQTYAGFGLSLMGVSAATSFIMGFVLKEADQAKEAHDELVRKADALDPLRDPAKLEALMPERRQAASLRTARDRETGLAGLLDMMFRIIPVHAYALFVKERRDGEEVFVLRACKTESAAGILQTGTALDPAKGRTGIDICAERRAAQYLPELSGDSASYLGYYERGAKDVPARSAVIIPVLSEDEESTVAVLAADKVTTDSFSEDTQEQLKLFSAFFLEVIKNSQLSLDLKTRADHFGALHDISTDLNSSLSFDAIMGSIIPQIRKIVPFDHCACLLRTEEDGKAFLQIAALDGYDKSMIGEKFPLDDSAVLGRAYRDWQDRPAREQDRDRTVYYDPNCEERDIGLFPLKELHLPIRSLYAKLLVPNEKFIGVFVLASRRPDAFSEYHRTYLLHTLMNQIGLAANNSLLHQQIERMARTDGLTGLLNHRTFMELLHAKYRELERTPRPFSILLMDIDKFKGVNDKYGHPIGDIAIKAVARILHDTIRGTDFVARYGGEEFAVGMVETDRKGAELMAERVRSLMERAVVTRVFDGELKCTISVGVVSYPEDTRDEKDLVNLVTYADQALYHAKKTGRNRVALYRDAAASVGQDAGI